MQSVSLPVVFCKRRRYVIKARGRRIKSEYYVTSITTWLGFRCNLPAGGSHDDTFGILLSVIVMSRVCKSLRSERAIIKRRATESHNDCSHSHINFSLIQNISNQPAKQHKTYCEEKRAEIHSCRFKNILEQPAIEWLIIRTYTDKPQHGCSQF